MVEILDDGRFLLNGRMDSVVKIEEKRISLTEVEGRILDSGFASDVCVVALGGKRQYLAAAIVFNDKGREKFAGLEKNKINLFWKEYLSQFCESIVLPKKWRYPEALPTDAQGKIKKEDVKLLFLGEKQALPGFANLAGVKLVERKENTVALEFSIPPNNVYFDGHFPGFSLLPAVAQMELLIRFASEYFGTGIDIPEMRRVKFSRFIRPNAPLLLRLEKREKNIAFKILSGKDESVYSTGTFSFCERKDT
jgi:3-hydroxymyristoyl/3-hydroxydecanoyl-(acyl carrier protein) dehydratase